MIYPGLTGPSFTSQSSTADSEDLINWYVQSMGGSPNAKVERVLYPTPGVTPWVVLTDGPVRGSVADAGRAFAVAGGTPFELKDLGLAGSATALGTVARDANPATLCSNGDGGNQLFITSGNAGYILDLTTLVLTKVLDGVTMGAMMDLFFLALDPVTSTLKISASNNGLVWDPTQFAQRSSSSDPWRAMIVGPGGGEIWLLGDRTADVWYNKGTFPFPFAPITSARIEVGTAAPFSAAWLDGPIWLAQSLNGARTVVRARGYSPVEISTEAVVRSLSLCASVADAEGFVEEHQGHPFYVLNIPSANLSWAYDDKENMWHRRGTFVTARGGYDAWHARTHMYAFDKHLVGDRTAGTIYRESVDLGLDFGGAPLRRLRRTNGLQHEQQRLFFSALELYLETGLALLAGQGMDALVQLRTSRDAGKTWGSIREKSAGKRGNYKKRVRWNQIGASRDRVDEIVVTDPIPWRIVGAVLQPRGAQA